MASSYDCDLQRIFSNLLVIVILLLIILYVAVFNPVVNDPETGNPIEAADEHNNYLYGNLPYPIQETQPVGIHPSHFYENMIKELLEEILAKEEERRKLKNNLKQLPKQENHEKQSACRNTSCTDFRHYSSHPDQETQQEENGDQQLSVPHNSRTSSESSTVPGDVGDPDPMSLSPISEDTASIESDVFLDQDDIPSTDDSSNGKSGDTGSDENSESTEGIADPNPVREEAHPTTLPKNEGLNAKADQDEDLAAAIASTDKTPARHHPDVATDESHHNSTVAYSHDVERENGNPCGTSCKDEVGSSSKQRSK